MRTRVRKIRINGTQEHEDPIYPWLNELLRIVEAAVDCGAHLQQAQRSTEDRHELRARPASNGDNECKHLEDENLLVCMISIPAYPEYPCTKGGPGHLSTMDQHLELVHKDDLHVKHGLERDGRIPADRSA